MRATSERERLIHAHKNTHTHAHKEKRLRVREGGHIKKWARERDRETEENERA